MKRLEKFLIYNVEDKSYLADLAPYSAQGVNWTKERAYAGYFSKLVAKMLLILLTVELGQNCILKNLWEVSGSFVMPKY